MTRTTTESQQLLNQTKSRNLYVVLTAIFMTNAVVAEIIGSKIFSLEALLGMPPVQLSFFGKYTLDFNLTCGVVIWPVVFITTDIINEYFGKQGVRRISFIAAAMIAYMFVVIWLVADLPPAQFWLDLYKTDSQGNNLNINESFAIIFRQGLGIIIGSLTAFLIGQVLDVSVFQWLRKATQAKHVWVRATVSTLVSQLVDSFVVLLVAFYVFGIWSFDQVIAVGMMNYIYKFAVAIALTPLIYGAHYVIDAYLGKDLAHQMADDAAKTGFF